MGSAPPPPSRLSQVPTASHCSLPAGSSLAKAGTSRDPAEPARPVPQDLGPSQLLGRRPPEGPSAPSRHPELDLPGMEQPGRKSNCKPRGSPVQTRPQTHRRREGRAVLLQPRQPGLTGTVIRRSDTTPGTPSNANKCRDTQAHLIYRPSPRPRGSWSVPGEPHQGRHWGPAPRAGLPSPGCCCFPFLTLLEKIKNE